MGTPAYMSPEQADDAATVDKRADIYSLGCTFYALLTGKPPFEGATLLEVITKHRQEKIQRPEVVVAGLPSVLGDIIERMTAKQPDDRYQDLSEVIFDLEVFLELRENPAATANASAGQNASSPELIHNSATQQLQSEMDHTHESTSGKVFEVNQSSATTSGSVTTTERTMAFAPELPADQAGKFQLSARQFNASPLVLGKRFLPWLWFGFCGTLALVSFMLGLWSAAQSAFSSAQELASTAKQTVGAMAESTQTNPVPTASSSAAGSATEHFRKMISRFKFTFGCLTAGIFAPVVALVLAGREGRSALALRYRESLKAGGVGNWIFLGFAAVAMLMIVHFLGLWVPTLLALVLGTAVAVGYDFAVLQPLLKHRQEPLQQAQTVIKQLRLRGWEESQIQQQVVKNVGAGWHEFFELLFGYQAFRNWQAKSGSSAGHRDWLSRIRDLWIDRWDEKLAEQRRVHDEKLLATTEKAELVASGLSAAEAQKQADAMAASMVDAAVETRQALQELAAGRLTDQAAAAKRQKIKQMLAQARSGKVSGKAKSRRAVEALMGHLLGGKFRFSAAVVLLLACGWWGNVNRTSVESYWQQAKDSVTALAEDATLDNIADKASQTAKSAMADADKQTWVAVLAGSVHERNVVYVALAGLIMLASCFVTGWRISLLVVPLAGLALAVPVFFRG